MFNLFGVNVFEFVLYMMLFVFVIVFIKMLLREVLGFGNARIPRYRERINI